MSNRDDLAAFAPSRAVLEAVHDRARAASEAARLGADAELRAVAAAAVPAPEAAPAAAQASDRAEQAEARVQAREVPRITASKVKIDPDAIAVALPAASPDDVTISPHRAAKPGGESMTGPTTVPGLGSPQPGSPQPGPGEGGAGAGTEGDAPLAPAASIDEAMREAALRVSEAQSREVYEREKRRRIVDEQTQNQLRKLPKGTKEHFEVLALRQRWTLPLDDGDYKLWMQGHLLDQHGGTLAEEASQKRIEKAKAVARGPAIVVGVLGLVAIVAAAGWWFGRGGAVDQAATPAGDAAAVDGRAAPVGAATVPAETAGAAATAATAPTAVPAASTTGGTGAVEPAPASSAAAVAAPVPSAPAAPRTNAPAAPPRSAGSGGKDIWEREF